jgi:hypothetical protein
MAGMLADKSDMRVVSVFSREPAGPSAEPSAEPARGSTAEAGNEPIGEPPGGSGRLSRLRRTSPGRAAYALAWLAAAVLVGTAVAFWAFEPFGWILPVALGVVAVLAIGGLHLAAVAMTRRHDTGFAAIAAGVVFLALPVLTAVALVAFAGSALRSTVSDVLNRQDTPGPAAPNGFEPGPGGQTEVIPEGTVLCQAPDGSMIPVDPASCVGGKYQP